MTDIRQNFDACQFVVTNLTEQVSPKVAQILRYYGFWDLVVKPDYIKSNVRGSLPRKLESAEKVAAEIWEVWPTAHVHFQGYQISQEWMEVEKQPENVFGQN